MDNYGITWRADSSRAADRKSHRFIADLVTCRLSRERCRERCSKGAQKIQLLPAQRSVEWCGFKMRLQRVAAIWWVALQQTDCREQRR